MTNLGLPCRRGVTLIELLVVVTILLLLSVLVLPSFGGAVNSRRNREAARNVSSFIARAQSRAINSTTPRGFTIQPLAADTAASIDMYFANAPEPYGGVDDDSRAVIAPSLLGKDLESQLPVQFLLSGRLDEATLGRLKDKAFCTDGDAIQFGGLGPYYRLVISGHQNGSGPPMIQMWSDTSQSPRNLSWPRTGGLPGVTYRISRQPRRASSGVLQLQKGAAVDVAWSCLGTQPLGPVPGQPAIITDPTKPVTFLFGSTGKPLEIVHSGGERTRVTEPLFLLIGSSQLSGNQYVPSLSGDTGTDPEQRDGTNWQYSDSAWLCVDNQSGVVKSGPVASKAKSVFESQRYIRQTVGQGVSER